VTIREARAALRSRRASARELVQAALSRIERTDGTLRAFLTVTAESAMARALQSDAARVSGREGGPLAGIPIAVKDLFYTRGVRTTGGSKIFANFVPETNAAVVDRLEAAGAILLGKLNMHELAYGITSANPHYGAVRNPWNVKHIPGGSSGGSGAAVAAGMAYAAMGSDTGGSIRIPASFCGVVGLKPTYGRVSRFGCMPLSWSLDHVGPLTRSVRDAAIVLNAIAGHDPRDPASSRHPVVDFEPEEGCSIRGLRIGFPENFFFERLDDSVESAVRGAIARASSLGAIVKPVTAPDPEAMNAVARTVLLAEASAVMEPYMDRREEFGADVLSLLDQGRVLPATSYIQAQRLRRVFGARFRDLWGEVDCLLTPATAITAPPVDAKTVRLGRAAEDVRLASTRLVRAINLLGLPALSMPCGIGSSGLPVGLQIVGPAFQEAVILRVGAALEDAGVGIPPCPAG
jgi:aspartyl-tRNA(Asn)/glutamyl-tRNA(Gln) amidotransferase subunit A